MVNKNYIPVVLAASVTACNMEFAAEQSTLPPVFAGVENSTTLEVCKDQANYNGAVELYRGQYHDLLSPHWSNWMIDHYGRFCRAFDIAGYYITEKDKKVSFAVHNLFNIPSPYLKPWTEEEHRSDLEHLLELAFPGWNFGSVII
jgi:hypothetical protein